MIRIKWLMLGSCLLLCLMGCEHKEQPKFNRNQTRYELNHFLFAVKDSDGKRVGPGNNIFSDSKEVVFQDESGGIHLRLIGSKNEVVAAEIVSLDAKGWGLYEFVLEGNLDQIPAHVMVSPFLYADDKNEVDIEFSAWDETDNEQESPWLKEGNYQFIVQPYNQVGNSIRPTERLVLDCEEGIPLTSYRIYNLEDKVQIEMYEGRFEAGRLIDTWDYPHGILEGDDMRFHLNVYVKDGNLSKVQELSEPIEIILKEFNFIEATDLH